MVTADPPFYGPFNGAFIPDGDGLEKKLADHDSVLRAESPWSLYCWIRTDEASKSATLVAGVGDPNEEYPRYLGLDAGKVILWLGKDNSFEALQLSHRDSGICWRQLSMAANFIFTAMDNR